MQLHRKLTAWSVFCRLSVGWRWLCDPMTIPQSDRTVQTSWRCRGGRPRRPCSLTTPNVGTMTLKPSAGPGPGPLQRPPSRRAGLGWGPPGVCSGPLSTEPLSRKKLNRQNVNVVSSETVTLGKLSSVSIVGNKTSDHFCLPIP